MRHVEGSSDFMKSDIFEKKQKNNLVNSLEYRAGMIPAGDFGILPEEAI